MIELNSNNHYKHFDGKWQLDLKSTFRERMLREWGYEYYNMRVEDYTNSNYKLLINIRKVIEKACKERTNHIM